MIVLKDIATGRYVTTVRASARLPALVELRDAERFKTRMEAGLAMLRLPLTILAVAVEATTEAGCDTCAEYGEACPRHGSERHRG